MIFLSYARKDLEEVSQLKSLLQEKFGNEFFFMDIKDIEIGHINFVDKISAALERTDIFVAYITDNYLNSEMCKIEFNSYFLTLISNMNKKIIPYYPRNIVKETPLIYRGVNSLIEKPIKEIIDIIEKIQKGELITELKNPLQNEFNINSLFANAVILDFLYYNRHFANPTITIYLNKDIDWNKHFGSYDNIWYNLYIKWKPLVYMRDVPNNKSYQSFKLSGTYFAGLKDEISIGIVSKTNLPPNININLYILKQLSFNDKKGIFEKIIIEDHRGIIGEIKLN